MIRLKRQKLSFCGSLLLGVLVIGVVIRTLEMLTYPVFASGSVTPEPFISNAQLIPVVQEMLADPDCELPCFLGLEPGKTSGDELSQVIEQLGLSDYQSVVTPKGAINYQLDLFFEPGFLEINFKGRNNQLQRMNVVLIDPENRFATNNPLDLSTLFQKLGTPSDIYVAINGGNPLTSTLTLVYSAQQVMVQYMFAFPNLKSSSLSLSICPNSENVVRVEAWLQNKIESQPILGYLDPAPDASDTFGSNWTLKRMTGMDIQAFVELFRHDTNACIEVPSTRDLYDLGYRVS